MRAARQLGSSACASPWSCPGQGSQRPGAGPPWRARAGLEGRRAGREVLDRDVAAPAAHRRRRRAARRPRPRSWPPSSRPGWRSPRSPTLDVVAVSRALAGGADAALVAAGVLSLGRRAGAWSTSAGAAMQARRGPRARARWPPCSAPSPRPWPQAGCRDGVVGGERQRAEARRGQRAGRVRRRRARSAEGRRGAPGAPAAGGRRLPHAADGPGASGGSRPRARRRPPGGRRGSRCSPAPRSRPLAPTRLRELSAPARPRRSAGARRCSRCRAGRPRGRGRTRRRADRPVARSLAPRTDGTVVRTAAVAVPEDLEQL